MMKTSLGKQQTIQLLFPGFTILGSAGGLFGACNGQCKTHLVGGLPLDDNCLRDRKDFLCRLQVFERMRPLGFSAFGPAVLCG